MPRMPSVVLSLLLATVLHVDWHLARPAHHPRSLGWTHHWIATGLLFLIAGCVIARQWPAIRWRMATTVLLASIVIAQVVEPVVSSLIFDGRFAYDVPPERWVAFAKAAGAGVAGLASGLLCVRRPHTLPAA